MSATWRRLRQCTVVTMGLGTTSCAVARELSHVEPINFTAGVITGVVSDSLTLQPIFNAHVLLLTLEGDTLRDQTTRTFAYPPDGVYRFANVRPGSYLLRVRSAGYDSVTITISAVQAGDRRVVEVKLRPLAAPDSSPSILGTDRAAETEQPARLPVRRRSGPGRSDSR